MAKILVSGDVEGNFTSLFSRVSKVHSSKAGPFDVLLCVGSFFGRKGGAELTEYIEGKKKVPLPTYFIAGDEFDSSLIDSLPAGGQLCPNLHYLGRSGVSKLSLGNGKSLNVAYLSGHYDQSAYFGPAAGGGGGSRNVKYQPNYIEEDVLSVMSAGIAAEDSLDLLLTHEWGKGWANLLPPERLPKSMVGPPTGSPVVAKLGAQLAARYHFAGSQDMHLELAPYRTRHYCTRFLGLAKVASVTKEKNLYAFNLLPGAAVDKNKMPEGVTQCPYTANNKPPPSAAAAAAAASHHPFPTEQSSNKRQRLDPAAGAAGAPPTDRFAPGFLANMQQYDAASMDTGSALRWDFSKPQRGPPPPNYICRACEEPGHWIQDCPKRAAERQQRGERSDVPPPDYVCKKCNQPGHYIRMCPLVLAENEAKAAAARSDIPPPDYVCKRCGQSGHYIRLCPEIIAENEARAVAAAAAGVPVNKVPPPHYLCKKCSQPGHWIEDCPLIEQEKEKEKKQPPATYVCKVCNIPGHWLKDCELKAKQDAERAERRALLPTPSGLDANGLPVGTKQDCWFCLATEHVATHLILSVGVECYLTLAKGPVNEEHALILPIVHVSSTLELNNEQQAEVDKYKLALRRYYRSQGQECIVYERYIPTRAAQHMHIQIIPISREQAREAKARLHEEAKKLSDQLTFLEIPQVSTLAQANPSKQPFILFELPALEGIDGAAAADASSASTLPASAFPVDRLLHFVNQREKIPGLFDFARVASAHLAGKPDRSDWKKCSSSEAEETEMVEKMKEKFAPFDFTLEGEEEAMGAEADGSAAAPSEVPAQVVVEAGETSNLHVTSSGELQ